MIRIQGLVKRHGSFEVLKGVSLNVAKGEVAAKAEATHLANRPEEVMYRQ